MPQDSASKNDHLSRPTKLEIDEIAWRLVMGARFRARQQGIDVTTYVANLIAVDLTAEADKIRQALAGEKNWFMEEREAMVQALENHRAAGYQ